MTQMNTYYHEDLTMKKIFAFFASLREIIEFFQWTHRYKKRDVLVPSRFFWWRWRESNPRPQDSALERLRA